MLRIEVGKADVADHGYRPIDRQKLARGEQIWQFTQCARTAKLECSARSPDVTLRPPIGSAQFSMLQFLTDSGPRAFEPLIVWHDDVVAKLKGVRLEPHQCIVIPLNGLALSEPDRISVCTAEYRKHVDLPLKHA